MPKPPRVYKSPAIVLRQRELGETDKIITLYTAEFGKIDAVAKGVRRIKSRLAGNVEPLSHAEFMLARGRNLDVITQIQPIESFQKLRDDLGRLSHALYAAELLDRATEEREENFSLYRLLLDTLRRLMEDQDLPRVLRYYEMGLLAELGYMPELEQCVVCRSSLAEGELVKWAPALGGVVCSACKPEGVALRAMHPAALVAMGALQTASYDDVASQYLDDSQAEDVERLLRDAIHYALDQDVRSAAFLDDVRKGAARTSNAGAT